MTRQAFRAELGAGGAKRQHFGVRRGVGAFARAVPGAGHDLAAGADHDRAHRNLAPLACGAGFFQCGLHVGFERHGPRCPQSAPFRKRRKGAKRSS